MRRRDQALARALLGTAVFTALVGCGNSKPRRAELLFSRGPGSLYLVDAESGATRRVPGTGALWADTARWSPDGDRIVFAAGKRPPAAHGDGEVYMADLGGETLRRLTDDSFEEYEPTLSHDGSRLAVIRGPNGCGYHGGGSNVILMSLDGKDSRTLTRDCLAHSNLSWAPDGKKLLFNASKITLGEIHVLDLEDGSERRLTEWTGDDPKWSPDGAWIAFTDSRPRGQFLVVMRPDGSGKRDLVAVTKNGSGVYGFEWSPNGRTIAYSVLNADGSSRIELVGTDGEGRRVLVTDGPSSISPTWSADGKSIAFVLHDRGDAPRRAQIAVVGADGQNLRVLPKTAIRDRFSAVEPRWRP